MILLTKLINDIYLSVYCLYLDSIYLSVYCLYSDETNYIHFSGSTYIPQINNFPGKVQWFPHYQARFQMHWHSKILLNCPLQERSPTYNATFPLQMGWLCKTWTVILLPEIYLNDKIRGSTGRICAV